MFCHFRISIAGSPPQKVVFQLHNDKCPKTCDNFIALCQSSATAKKKRPPSSSSSTTTSFAPNEPTYRGTEFHRILSKFMIQGGDFTNFDGTGGHAAPITNNGQPTFPDENFDISHDQEGILSMANKGKNTNGSQFFITLGKTLHLDGKHVAFGRVFRGMDVVREASNVETEGDNGRPGMLQRVVIVDCGVGMGDEDDEDDEDGSDGSSSYNSLTEEEDGCRQRKKRCSSKKKRRSRKEEDYKSHHKKKKKKKKSHDGSRSHSKHCKKRSGKDECSSSRDYKDRKKRKEKSSSRHRHRSREDSSSSEEEDDGGRHHHHHNSRSSKKRRKRD